MGSFKGYSYGRGYAVYSIDTSGVDLNGFKYTARRAVKSYLEQVACPAIREYMVSHHGWQNQTYTAEKGLTCDVKSTGNIKGDEYSLKLRMYHTAYHNGYQYGRVLEGLDPWGIGKNKGKRSDELGVLKRTKDLFLPVVINDMKGILDKYS